MILVDLLQQDGFTLKRVATTNGGEYSGACPWCGGRDRFRVWPEEDRGRYWCRRCGKTGDSISYLREIRGVSFLEACAELGIDRPEQQQTPRATRVEPSARFTKEPPAIWQKKARDFVTGCQDVLKTNRAALALLRGRGLKPETIERAALGWNMADCYESREGWGLKPLHDEKGRLKKLWLPAGLVIPLIVGGRVLRLRIRRPQGEPRYYIMPGSDTRPMTFNLDKNCLVIVESELDGLLIAQGAGDLVGTVALGTATSKPDQELNGLLKRASSILVSLDFDGAGAKAAWKFWLQSYPEARRWPTPYGKDPSEAAQKGLNIRAWVEAGVAPGIFTELKQEPDETTLKPFPKEWLQRFDEEQLERLAIMTADGGLSDQEAMSLFCRS